MRNEPNFDESSIPPQNSNGYVPTPPLGWNLKDEIQKTQKFVEQYLIQKALDETNGNCKAAAALLGISRASFYNKIQKPVLNTEQ